MENQVLVEAFKATIVPYLIQLTMIMAYYGFVQSVWELFRKKNNFKQLFEYNK